MINLNAGNKANTAQSLLPSFTETTDISGDSFQSVFNSLKENSSDISNSIYSKKDNSFLSYREKNSYSSYADKNNYNEYRSEEKRYDKNDDRENYSAVERKEFRDDSPSSRNVKDTNTVKEQNVFEQIAVESCSFDTILARTGMDFGELTLVLTNLELKGYIKMTDGSKYQSLVNVG